MLPPRILRRVYLPIMLAALSGVAFIAFVLLREGLFAGRAETWMVLWMVAFVVALPGVLLLLPALASMVRLAHVRDNVPHAGGNVP